MLVGLIAIDKLKIMAKQARVVWYKFIWTHFVLQIFSKSIFNILRFSRAQNLKHVTDTNACFFCIALTERFCQTKIFRIMEDSLSFVLVYLFWRCFFMKKL